MRFTADANPVRKIVVVRVGVVEKTALLDDEPPRVLARCITAIPAERPFTDGLLERCDRALHLCTLFIDVHVLETDPAPAVRAHLVPGRCDRARRLRIAFERERGAENRNE